jgi:dCMP deaminase
MQPDAQTRPPWDTYFLNGARWVSTRSDCRRRQQGTLIVKDRRVISTGYIGVAPGMDGCLQGACPRGLLGFEDVPAYADYDSGPGRCISTHSEANAIIFGDWTQMQGATLYTWPGKPCTSCSKLIQSSGIARVVWADGTEQR